MGIESGQSGSGESADYQAFSDRAQGTNINPQTLLATDYLNHFNEIVMLLEMIPDMAECYDDAMEWQPKSYQDHFRDSQFRDRDLAVEAYEHVPQCYREPFDNVISQMDRMVPWGLQRIGEVLNTDETERLRFLCSDTSLRLQKMIDLAGAIIHGSTKRLDQSEIDGFLAD